MAVQDRRELILARAHACLTEIAAANTSGYGDDMVTAYRDRAGLEGIAGTKLLLLDGDEVSRLSTYGHTRGTPPHNLMTLQPEVWVVREIKENVKNANAGPEYSAWRVKILKKIMFDETLLGLLGEEGQIEFMRFETDLKNENAMLGTMLIDIDLTYVFDPDEL